MNPSFSLILEIQSGLVNAALVADRRILHSVSVPIAGAPHSGGAHLFTKMSQALSDALGACSTAPGMRSASRIDCILSTPWIISRTESVKITYPKPTRVTKRSVGAAISAERQKMSAAMDAGGSGLICIEQKIFEIKVNGYAVADFEGKTARELEIFFAVSMAPGPVLDLVADAVRRHAGPAPVAYHSSVLLGYAMSRENTGSGENYILSHIHGELSDIVVVRRGITTLIASFPFGYSGLVRGISVILGEPELAAKSKIALHSSKGLHAEEENRVRTAIDNVLLEKWVGRFFDAIAASAAASYAVFLAVPGEYYPHFERALQAKKKEAEKDAGSEQAGLLHKIHVFAVNHINTQLIHSLLRL